LERRLKKAIFAGTVKRKDHFAIGYQAEFVDYSNRRKGVTGQIESERLNSVLPGNSEIKTEKINTSRSSLDSILKKIDKRMALIETKLVKVNELGTNIAIYYY